MTNPIGALFGRSPIRPIQGHMAKAHSSVELLGKFIQHCIDENWDQAKASHDSIVQLEQDADEMKRDIRAHLPKSLFLPFSRGDLLELLNLQDQLANYSKRISHLLLTRHKSIPGDLVDPLIDVYKANLEAVDQAKIIINELDELLETGFKGKETELVDRLVGELDKREHHFESVETELRSRLYGLEDSLNAVDVVFLDKLTDQLSELNGLAHRIGDQLMLMMAN